MTALTAMATRTAGPAVAELTVLYDARCRMCRAARAWAGYRGLAHRLATPRLRPLAARVVSTAARVRERQRGTGQYGGRDDRAGCDNRCRR